MTDTTVVSELGIGSHGDVGDLEDKKKTTFKVVENTKDYFIERNGKRYAGTHLLVDLWGAHHLDDIHVVEAALRKGAHAAGATILHCHLHHFEPNGGVSGVLVLAESHISIHTWPENSYAALDVFMCGECDPHQAIPALQEAFQPETLKVDEQLRGEGV